MFGVLFRIFRGDYRNGDGGFRLLAKETIDIDSFQLNDGFSW
jgi:hypothetical protein